MRSWSVIVERCQRLLGYVIVYTFLYLGVGSVATAPTDANAGEAALWGILAGFFIWGCLSSSTRGVLESKNRHLFHTTPMRRHFYIWLEIRREWYLIVLWTVLVPLAATWLTFYHFEPSRENATIYHRLLNLHLFYFGSIAIAFRERLGTQSAQSILFFPLRHVFRINFRYVAAACAAFALGPTIIGTSPAQVLDALLGASQWSYVAVGFVSPLSGLLAHGGPDWLPTAWTCWFALLVGLALWEIRVLLRWDVPLFEYVHFENYLGNKKELEEVAEEADDVYEQRVKEWQERYVVTSSESLKEEAHGEESYRSDLPFSSWFTRPWGKSSGFRPKWRYIRWILLRNVWLVVLTTLVAATVSLAGRVPLGFATFLLVLGHFFCASTALRRIDRAYFLFFAPIKLTHILPRYMVSEFKRSWAPDALLALVFAAASQGGIAMFTASFISLFLVRAASLLLLFLKLRHDAGVRSLYSPAQAAVMVSALIYGSIASFVALPNGLYDDGTGRETYPLYVFGFGLCISACVACVVLVAHRRVDSSLLGGSHRRD